MATPPTPSQALPLEDNHLDIIGKARRGWELSDRDLIAKAGISVTDYERMESGEILPEVLLKLAPVLKLAPGALVASANGTWRPEPVDVPCLKTFTTPFGDMNVNAYIAWDPACGKAVVFDSGADVSEMLAFASAEGLTISLILITHTHGDHIFDLDRLMEKTRATAFVGDMEPPLEGAEPFHAGKSFEVGNLSISTRLTWGHAEGGITYVIRGLSRLVAVVGDAIFAGSMGGGKVSWPDALKTARAEILSLPEDTVLASGHGPLTTVGEEIRHNPFFAA